MEYKINTKIIEKIFQINNISQVQSINRMITGFTNLVYDINNEYILKICTQEKNEVNFKKELYFYNLLKNEIPVPHVLFHDFSKEIIDRYFMVYKKIEGCNLYSIWHQFNDVQKKKEIVKQICKILKKINQTPYDDYTNRFNIDADIDWHKEKYTNIKNYLEKVSKRNIISSEFIKGINDFVEKHHSVLSEQKLSLVYWDVHFDNFLVKDGIITGILDFERIGIMSIDYVLDLVRRLTEYPETYVTDGYEKFIRKEDYSKIFSWYKIYYPELFQFHNLNIRLDLYSTEYDLRLLIDWPKSEDLKKRLAKTVNYTASAHACFS